MSEGDLFDDLPPAGEENPPRREEPIAADREADGQLFAEAETAPAPEPVPEPIPEPEPQAPKRRMSEPPHPGSLGEVLRELRKSRGMDLRSVAEATRIKESYLAALENNDFADLPHMVYTLAYVKKLCDVYGVGSADADELMADLRKKLSYEIPEDIDKSVICREQDEETRRKLQQITIALFAGAALCVLLLVIGATTLILGASGKKSAGEKPVAGEQLAEDWLEWHRPQQQLRTTRIDLVPYHRPPRRNAPRR